MPRVTLSDGRWLELRPIWVSDRMAVIDLQRRAADMTEMDALTDLASIVERGLLGKAWDGTLLDMSTTDLLGIIAQWGKASEDDALPPVTGTPSSEPLPDGGSEEQTDSPSEPASLTALSSTGSR